MRKVILPDVEGLSLSNVAEFSLSFVAGISWSTMFFLRCSRVCTMHRNGVCQEVFAFIRCSTAEFFLDVGKI